MRIRTYDLQHLGCLLFLASALILTVVSLIDYLWKNKGVLKDVK